MSISHIPNIFNILFGIFFYKMRSAPFSTWAPAPQNVCARPCPASSRTQTTPVTVFSICCHLASASGAWWQKLRDWGGASSLRPSGSKLKLCLKTFTRLNFNKWSNIYYHPYCCYVYTRYNLFAHSSCTSLLILLFIKSTVYCIAHFALSIERTWPDLHFTTDYILYNWVCDK